MKNVVPIERADDTEVDLSAIPREVTEEDERLFRKITSTELDADQRNRVTEASRSYPKQRSVLGIHWHPEFIPLDLIRQRIDQMFPNREADLIIPTQHNVLVSYGSYTGVEVDCYSRGFNRKIQLLFHFANDKLEGRGDVFRSMLDHTFKYRASQLFEFIDSLVEPAFQDRVDEAAAKTWADEDLIEFVRIVAQKLKRLIDLHENTAAREMIKNKLIRNFLDELRPEYGDRLINHAQIFVNATKKIVKRNFALDYFYETNEVIEEGRGLGAGIVIPHPEQFWPVLLADLDVDGIEVWNPQSFEYTEFLINAVHRENLARHGTDRPILVTMGDDCHMGEKVKDPRHQDAAKTGREIGVQPPWDDLTIRKSLIIADASRSTLIREYRARLNG